MLLSMVPKRNVISLICILVTPFAVLTEARADADVFVVNSSGGTVGEYTTGGQVINSSLITDPITINDPQAIAVSGSNLYVVNYGNGTISQFTTSGSLVNAALISAGPSSGISGPYSIAVTQQNIFVGSGHGVEKFTLSGATVNSTFVTGLSAPRAMTVYGNDLFVADSNSGTITEFDTNTGMEVGSGPLVSNLFFPTGIAVANGHIFVLDDQNIREYTLTGALMNAQFVSGLTATPKGLAEYNGTLYETNLTGGTIGEYRESDGTPVGTGTLISGLQEPFGIAIVPEPTVGAFLSFGACFSLFMRRRRKS
ncbi:NHL repeat-containing protein [Chthoniobacter flavus]|nr:hypothetical protein [Chthoniobacter flavus]